MKTKIRILCTMLFALIGLNTYGQELGNRFDFGFVTYEITSIGSPNTVKLVTTTETGPQLIMLDTVEYLGESYDVTSIGLQAFYDKPFTSVVIGNKVTTIDKWAFIYNHVLTHIVIPASVTTIVKDAFYVTGIKKMVLLGTTAPSYDGSFTGTTNNVIDVIHPSGITLDDYETAGWPTDEFKSFLAVGDLEETFKTTWNVPNADRDITIPTNSDYTYNYIVDWGDGTELTQHTGSADHEYPFTIYTSRDYTVSVYVLDEAGGTFPAIYFQNSLEATSDKLKIKTVDQWGDINWKSMYGAFFGCANLDITANDSPNLSNVENAAGMFRTASSITGTRTNMNDWDTDNITTMNLMFDRALEFNGDISEWDLSNVEDTSGMFKGAPKFNGDIGDWDVSNVTNMNQMFGDATEFNQNLGAWDISGLPSGESVMYQMLLGSGLSYRNIEYTLQGWVALDNTPTNMTIGVENIAYCKEFSESRETLIDDYGWTMSGGYLFEGCLSNSNIESFTLTEQTTPATISAADYTVAIEVIYGTDLTDLAPGFSLSDGATSNFSSGNHRNFTDPVSYTVTSKDLLPSLNIFISQEWIVTVSEEAPNTETDITEFTIGQQTGDPLINPDEHTVTVQVPFDTDRSALVPTFNLSDGATSNPLSEATINFNSPVEIIVTAQDMTTQVWTVTVVIAPNTETDITEFAIGQQTGDPLINPDEHTVTVQVPFDTDRTNLEPTITLSEGATTNLVDGTDFSSPVEITVTAQDNMTIQVWTVTVEIAPNTKTDITEFTIDQQTGDTVIDLTNHTIKIQVPFDIVLTELTNVTPTFTLSEGATSNLVGGTDFSSPVEIIVTAQDNLTTQVWTVTVEIALNTQTDILSFAIGQQTGDINTTNHTVIIQAPFDTELTNVAPGYTLSEGATTNLVGGATIDFTDPVNITVTAQDGVTEQKWTVTVEIVQNNTQTDILSFAIGQQTGVINTDEHTVVILVVSGTDISALTPSYTLPEGATSNPLSGANINFSSPVNITVTAQDTTTRQVWTVIVNTVPSAYFIIDKITYGITYLDANNNRNTVTAIDNTNTGSIIIPGTVSLSGNEYTVTSIGERAFESNNLTSVTIPNTVTNIGEKAFADNPIIEVITLATIPPTLFANTFTNREAISLSVPSGTLEEYTVGWTGFITGTLTTNEPEQNYFTIYPNPAKDEIHINISSGQEVHQVSIYTITGVYLYATSALEIDTSRLANGMYLLKVETKTGTTSIKKLVIAR